MWEDNLSLVGEGLSFIPSGVWDLGQVRFFLIFLSLMVLRCHAVHSFFFVFLEQHQRVVQPHRSPPPHPLHKISHDVTHMHALPPSPPTAAVSGSE